MKRLNIRSAAAAAAAVAVGVGCYWPFVQSDHLARLPGTVEVQEVRPTSKAGGRVTDVLVREGEPVAAGQPLVALAAPELEAQRDQVAQRLAAARALRQKAHAGNRPEEKRAARAAQQAAEARWRRLVAGSR